mgnify:CR=1 FL=1
MEDKIENMSTPSDDTIHSVRVSALKITDFVKGFKFRYRGKPKCWLVGDGETMGIIEYDISLLEDELQLGYIDPY